MLGVYLGAIMFVMVFREAIRSVRDVHGSPDPKKCISDASEYGAMSGGGLIFCAVMTLDSLVDGPIPVNIGIIFLSYFGTMAIFGMAFRTIAKAQLKKRDKEGGPNAF